MPFLEEEILDYIHQYGKMASDHVLRLDCERIERMLDRCELTIPKENRFFAVPDHGNIASRVMYGRQDEVHAPICASKLYQNSKSLAYTGACDFGHTSAGWESVISLGIFGLRNRISEYAARADEGTEAFYDNLLRVYDAALRFMRRAADVALAAGKQEMARGLRELCEHAPSNLFEAMQTSIVYYVLQQYFDGTVLRTLGRPDGLFYPFYEKADKADADLLIADYIAEIDRLKAVANIPFALGGSDENGVDLTNALSYAFLHAYGSAQTQNVKLHLLWNEKTPHDFVEAAFRYIRSGNNSIVFMSDRCVISALEGQGVTHRDAARYHIVGCYECGGDEELTCSCNARVNVPKALELALNGGRDMLTGELLGLENNGCLDSYEALFEEFCRQLSYLCGCAMELTDLFEAEYAKIHSAPILSATYCSALEKAGDLYCDYTAKYNSSSLNALGLATAADSLAAIRKAVFEDRTVSLARFVEILKSNWENEEHFRLLIKNKYPKYGMGDARTDAIAKRIVDVLSDSVRCKPNAKGGKWRLGLFSINWRWAFGEKTAASADGRCLGEPISQNTGASFGCDREGATPHLLSVASIDATRVPNGAIADIDLHSSAVRGENGIRALVSSLEGYFSLGGFAVHYNVLDTETLMDARKHPEKYPNLQVRLCGWNVRYTLLSEKEQMEFIERSTR
ncbi:MAG: hypothetical protein J6J66_04970 [Clostridia bacterium]|nr:hypothetical protein [Clostridia bacterium]